MADRYIKSLFWLCSFSGLGYGLLVLGTPSESDIDKLKKELPGVEKQPDLVYNQKKQFTDVLRAASQASKPFYRMTKEEIEREIRKHQ